MIKYHLHSTDHFYHLQAKYQHSFVVFKVSFSTGWKHFRTSKIQLKYFHLFILFCNKILKFSENFKKKIAEYKLF